MAKSPSSLTKSIQNYFNILQNVQRASIPMFVLKQFDITFTAYNDVLLSIQTMLQPQINNFESSFREMSSLAKGIEMISPSLLEIYSQIQENLNMSTFSVNEIIRQEFSTLLNETTDTVPLDNNSYSIFKDISSKVKQLTVKQIFSFILTIITVLDFVLGLLPDNQLEESNELKKQQIQLSQQTNDLLQEQNALIEESNDLARERVEQLNKIVELRDQYAKLLLEISEYTSEDCNVSD